MLDEDNGQRVASLERALQILDAFRRGAKEKSLADLSTATGLYKSTILRLSASLERFGFLTRLSSGKFVLGSAVFELGRLFEQSFLLADRVKPILRELSTITKESATLWILDDRHRVCLLRVDSPQHVRDTSISEGDRLLLDNGATSLVLRAFSDRRGGKLAKVREDMHSVSFGGYSRDLAGVARPVFKSGGDFVGALTVAGPSGRFTPAALRRFEGPHRRASIQATKALGGDPSIYEAAP